MARLIKKARVKNGKMNVVNNPHAGAHTGHAGIGKVITGILASPPSPTRIYDTQDLADLEAAITEISEDDDGEILMIGGGDGSLYQAMTRYMRQLVERYPDRSLRELEEEIPLIALIPTGTMNMVATTVGANRMGSSPMALFERIEEKRNAGAEFDVSHCRIMRINDDWGFIYGAGIVTDLLRNYYADRSVRGGRRVAQVLSQSFWAEFRHMISFGRRKGGLPKPVDAMIRLEGHDPALAPYMTHSAILCSTIDQLGFGARAMPDALRHDEKFMLRSTTLSYLQLARVSPMIWAGMSLPDTFDALVRKAVIEYQGEPVVRVIDGELLEPALRDELEIGPLLKFIIG